MEKISGRLAILMIAAVTVLCGCAGRGTKDVADIVYIDDGSSPEELY